MTLELLKTQIETNTVEDKLIILCEATSKFITNQYIHAIANCKKLDIEYVDSIEELTAGSDSLFSFFETVAPASLRVFKTEVFDYTNPKLTQQTHTIVVTSKIAKGDTNTIFEDYIIKVPPIEDWMIRDYVYSTVEGVSHKELDKLINICGTNYDRLQLELDKVTLFSEPEREYLFADLLRDGAVDDLSSYSIFNFTNAITSKDIPSIKSIYKELTRMDVNEFGLLTILTKNFRNIIMVQLNSNPTPENTGLESKQLYAISKIPRKYTADQLVGIYQMLLKIDSQIKSGELPTEYVIDYIVTKILSM